MSHFGVICPELSGHLNPTMSVARELERRGHRVTFYTRVSTRKKIESAGFTCRPFAVESATVENIAAEQKELAELTGIAALRHTIAIIARRTEACLAEVPGMMEHDGVDVILGDQVCREAATIAEQTGRPFVLLCNALALNPEPDIPAFCTTWAYKPSVWRRLRNRVVDRLLQAITGPLRAPIDEHRRKMGFAPVRHYLDYKTPPLLEITQLPREFDFPRLNPPANFHYTGPAIDGSVREECHFPFDRLDGRPLVYASMGTLQNRLTPVFQAIAGACEGSGVQVVLSLGGGCKPESLPKLPGDPIVVEFAPQLELLKRAALCITHAGLNTTLESLACGVPMVAIPVTNDQPGVASRIKYSGTGEFISLKRLTRTRLRELVATVRGDPRYAAKAKGLQADILASGGPRRAATLIEGAIAA